MANPQTTTGAREAVTAAYDFCNTTSDGDCLFSIRAGVPISQAFDRLSLLIRAARDAVQGEAERGIHDGPDSKWSAATCLDIAEALAQSMHQGFNRGRP